MSVHLYAQQKNKLQQDRDAIKSLAGCYKVTFEFAETFAPDTSYQYHPRKFDWGIEYVFIIEDTDRKISLQHLLIVNDTTIVKHWRQDWVYENTELLSYYKDNEWKKIKLPADKAKGTWTQKVYQVDDSPRYEGYGTWLHVDGRHFWESVCDAPLPRREILKRNDYNVLRRHSRIELTPYGWILEQDNEKIIRSQEGDKLLCWEKGFEKFLRGDYNCQPAIKWWEKNKLYWADVRKVWNEIITQNNVVKIEKKIDNKFLFEQLFKIGDEFTKYTPYNSTEAAAAIRKSIDMYITKK
ncbi:MAG: hypothetical protein NZ529_02860 [Cytophagaceae bacterium]|nr:hypothetical protein [Cytophagaceae bacterium]MDW8455712.1 hypothetical protein [Cytophagaceae bacterium]